MSSMEKQKQLEIGKGNHCKWIKDIKTLQNGAQLRKKFCMKTI